MNKVVNSQNKKPEEPFVVCGFIILTVIIIGLAVCVITSYNNNKKSEGSDIPNKDNKVSKGNKVFKDDDPYYKHLRNVYDKDNEVSKDHEVYEDNNNFILGLAFLVPFFIVWVLCFRSINWSNVISNFKND